MNHTAYKGIGDPINAPCNQIVRMNGLTPEETGHDTPETTAWRNKLVNAKLSKNKTTNNEIHRHSRK